MCHIKVDPNDTRSVVTFVYINRKQHIKAYTGIYTNSCEWAMYIECTAYNSLKSCVTSKWTQMTHVEYSPTGLGNSPNINNVPIGDLAKLHHEDW